ncbi:MAG: Tm-1-like ATP-binding domain-containing protein [Thermomicrobiales bacterium]
MPTVCLIGTLDTKGKEYAYLKDRVIALGADVLLIDAGSVGPALTKPDIRADEVATAAGTTLQALTRGKNRANAIAAMATGVTSIVTDLVATGRIDGIAAIGGSGGSTLATEAMRALPVGFPKLMVSTVASGQTHPYVGAVDVTMMHSVVDIAGINRISRRILDNAAAAIVGMAAASAVAEDITSDKPLIAATMFGVTTKGVTIAREWLEARGNEVLVFHATGTGGQSMEALIGGGFISGVLDLTTTELADELVGGVLSAGPDRLEIAGKMGIPQVVSVGALDMVNFGARDTVPAEFEGRNLHVHNATVTLMRTTPEECAELGRRMAKKLNAATGPLAVFIPRKGVSSISIVGGPFHDPEADAALFDALLADLDDSIEVQDMSLDINNPAFAIAMADRLIELVAMKVTQT